MARKNITTDTAHFFLTDEFSQWYPSKFKDERGTEFSCCEQWMMYSKAALFGDTEVMKKVLETNDPDEMKKLGRQIKGFDQETWNDRAPTIVALGNVMKFSQNPELWEVLDKTGARILVEAADYDTIWGIGLKAEDAILVSQSEWKGSNWLGYAIMEARDLLRETPMLIEEKTPLEQKIFAFRDEKGQKTIRLNVVELADKLDCSVGEIPKKLLSMQENDLALKYEPFVKDVMTANVDDLLSLYNKFSHKFNDGSNFIAKRIKF
jgi:ribA/ribD-fused uncharacterized protein